MRWELAEEVQAEEVFGPAEGLHSTYRMIRDEVLESSWRAGSALSEMRLDTAEDVNAAVARYLELIKLASLLQRPDREATREALAAINELLQRVATPEQRAVFETSSLDDYVLGEEKAQEGRRDAVAARREPSLEQFIPRRGDGLALSASDIGLYRTCPLKYKFARVFSIPQEPTINQRFGILIHNVLERFHSEEMRARAGGPDDGVRPGSLDRLLGLLEAGWRRSGFGASDDELQYRDRAVASLARYHERHLREASEPVWLERSFSFAIGDHRLRGGSTVSTSARTAPTSSSTTRPASHRRRRSSPRTFSWPSTGSPRARRGSSRPPRAPIGTSSRTSGSRSSLRRTTPSASSGRSWTSAGGIEAQDFEPRPSFEICSWCDYRLICPASEA